MASQLFLHFEGTAAGPKGFSRPIRRSLTEYTEGTPYNIVLQPLLDVAVKNLSTAQQHMWQMSQAVSEGHCPCDLPLLKLEPLNHLQWLTTANKILRFYFGLDAQSDNQK